MAKPARPAADQNEMLTLIWMEQQKTNELLERLLAAFRQERPPAKEKRGTRPR